MTQGTAGRGRPAGSRNRRTAEIQAMAAAGETPISVCLRLLNDPDTDVDTKLHAARVAAPFVHARPQPEPRLVSFDIPEELQTRGLVQAHEALLRATAAGDIAVDDARDLSSMLDAHRRAIETEQLEERIANLEKAAAR